MLEVPALDYEYSLNIGPRCSATRRRSEVNRVIV